MTEAEKFCEENNVKFRLSNIGENIGVVALEYINMLEKENEQLKKVEENKEWKKLEHWRLFEVYKKSSS